MKLLAYVIVAILVLPLFVLVLPIGLLLYILKGIALGAIEFCEVLTGGKKRLG